MAAIKALPLWPSDVAELVATELINITHAKTIKDKADVITKLLKITPKPIRLVGNTFTSLKDSPDVLGIIVKRKIEETKQSSKETNNEEK